jgi:hypothetical protein
MTRRVDDWPERPVQRRAFDLPQVISCDRSLQTQRKRATE